MIMHQKKFGKTRHEVMKSNLDFSVLDKSLLDEHFGTEDQFSIYRNPNGMDVLLTNVSYPKLRRADKIETTTFHFSWDDTKQLYEFLGKILKNEKK